MEESLSFEGTVVAGIERRYKLSMLNMVHSCVLSVDEFADSLIRFLDTAYSEDREVYEAMTKLKVAIGPFIDGLAEIDAYRR